MDRIFNKINFEMYSWDFYISLAFVVLVIVMRKTIVRFGFTVVMRILKKRKQDLSEARLLKLLVPFNWFFVLLVIHAFLQYYFATVFTPRNLVILRIVYIAIFGWCIDHLLDYFRFRVKAKNHELPSLNQMMTNLLFSAAKALSISIVVMMIFSELGYDMNGLLAGVGLGGLAVALAAQDMLANIFGCAVIVFDRPFVLNDWIETSSFEGVVEEITFRSTRIRTFENALITVPNSKLASDVITNWSKMMSRRLQLIITVDYNVTSQQLEQSLLKIRQFMKTEPTVSKDNIRVYLDTLSTKGIEILVECFRNNQGYDEFLRFKENVNLQIMNIMKAENIKFVSISFQISNLENGA